jgi:hypothetical protein
VLATVAATAALVALPAASAPAARAAASRSTTRIGSVPVHPCSKGARLLCGGVRVPLDYSSAASPRIHIGFQWLPARSHALGTVLAVEGGPGYSSTGSG